MMMMMMMGSRWVKDQGDWLHSIFSSPIVSIRNFYVGSLTNGFVSSKISLTELERMKKDLSTTRELSSLLTVSF